MEAISEDGSDITDMIPANPIDAAVLEQIMLAKKGDPSQFPTFWEMDEQDIDEATEEQIKTDPVQRTLWAAEKGNLEVLKEMVETDRDLIMARDNDQYTPLHRASYEGHLDVVIYLLDNGADLEGQTIDGWTPLHSASYWGQAEVAAYLLARGANINAQTLGQQTPLHLAATNGESREMLLLLLMHPEVNYTLKNGQGDTAKDVAERTSKHFKLFEIADDSVNCLLSLPD